MHSFLQTIYRNALVDIKRIAENEELDATTLVYLIDSAADGAHRRAHSVASTLTLRRILMNTYYASRNHTPGPWELNGWGLIYGQPGPDNHEAPLVCDVARDSVGIMTDEEKANGCLIEAAPDMLHALETVAEDCRMALCGEWDKSDEGFEATLELVEAAIAIATGLRS